MKITNLIQNSDMWYEYRKTHIGASDICVFAGHLGLSKPLFKGSIKKHFQDKANGAISNNPYMLKGKEREGYILENYNNNYNKLCMPTCIEYSDNISCSLDGYDAIRHEAIEIKWTSHQSIQFNSKLQYYIYQLMHQMYCTDLEKIDLVVEFADRTIVHTVYLENLPCDKEEWLMLCNNYWDKYIPYLTKEETK